MIKASWYSLILLALIFFSCKSPSERDILFSKACNYLWQQQAADGGWHSDTHGIMKSGESLTPFILWTLLETQDNSYLVSEEKKKRGLDFIRQRIQKGRAGITDPMILDYPNYSTAYALRLLKKYGVPKDSTLIRAMGDYLVKQQFTEQRGFEPNDPVYGAWGFGETNLGAGQHGHVDLSHTRRVLQALHEADRLTKESKNKAAAFLAILQKSGIHQDSLPIDSTVYFDGGFFVSSVTLGTNKSNYLGKVDTQEYFESYATATCDGLLALQVLGLDEQDLRLVKAKDWLTKHPRLEYPEGLPEESFEQWHKVMRFYHLAVRSEAFRALGYKGTWQNEMLQILKKEQLENGSFLNPMGAPNKENDPLLATAFAIIALNNSSF